MRYEGTKTVKNPLGDIETLKTDGLLQGFLESYSRDYPKEIAQMQCFIFLKYFENG